MEKLPHLPRSHTHLKKIRQVSPTSIRILKQAVSSRDTSKFINLSSTVRSVMKRPISEGLELSFQLTTLRKNLDKFSLLKSHKEKELNELKSKMKQLQDSEIVKLQDIKREEQYYRLMQEIKNVQVSELEELDNQKVYEFMFERLRLSKKYFEKKEKKLRRILDENIHNAELQTRLRKETVDSVYQYRIVYKNTVDALEYEKNSLNDEILRMKNTSKMKKNMIAKTEEHNKHRLDIIEQTMIEERSAHFEEIRNSFLLYKLYDKYLLKKLDSEKEIFNRLDEAFQRVRIKTGLHNVDDVIEKFLTQEANYRALITGLHGKEKECNDYKKKITEMQAKVDQLNQEKTLKIEESEIQVKIEKLIRVKEKKIEMDQMLLKINIWIESMLKRSGKVNEYPVFENMKIAEKFEILKKFIKGILSQSQITENLNGAIENEKKNIKLGDIISTYRAVKVIKNDIMPKANSNSKGFHKLKGPQ